jgi:NADH dehydrogenase FAD-containing subunit
MYKIIVHQLQIHFSERPYPPTDQHAIRQVQLAIENIINNLENKIQEKQDTKQEVQ